MTTITLPATPTIVRVHYMDLDAMPRTFTAAMAATQPEGRIALVVNADAWQDPSVCCWQMGYDRITQVEVIAAGSDEATVDGPSIIETILAGLELSPWENLVYRTLADHGGPVMFTRIGDILDDAGRAVLEPHQVNIVLQSLIAKGRLSLTCSTDATPGVLTINGG